jgi:hypothetical protein
MCCRITVTKRSIGVSKTNDNVLEMPGKLRKNNKTTPMAPPGQRLLLGGPRKIFGILVRRWP